MDLNIETTCTTRNLQFITISGCFRKCSTETQKIVEIFNEKIIFNISLRITHVLTVLQSKLRISMYFAYIFAWIICVNLFTIQC